MLSFYDAASIAASPTAVADEQLRRLLTAAVHDWQPSELLDMTHLLVVEPGDTEEAIVEEVGFSPLLNPLNGARFGSPEYQPFWDWLQDHDGWFELIVTVGNSGFAYVLFIRDCEQMNPQLLAACRAYSGGVG